MAKFKVGDKVRVIGATDHRQEHNGQIYTIEDINCRGLKYYKRLGIEYYSVKETNYIFYEDEVESVTFTKADLKDGMVVEIKGDRTEKRFMVLGDKVRGYNEYMRLEAFDDDLTHMSGSELLTIVKVYNSTASALGSYLNSGYLELLWERPKEEPVKEMTIEEIEKIVGCKVKVVGSEGK